MYLINLRSGESVSLEPKDHKEADQYFFDYRLGENETSYGGGADRRSFLAPLPHDQDSSSSDSDSDSVGKGAGGNYIDELEQAAIARKARKRFKFSGL